MDGVTRSVDKVYCKDQKCKLSYQSASASSESDTVGTTYQLIKLFMSPDIDVPEGSKIEVTQNGRTDIYKRSGKPMVYSNHQEILLDRVEKT